MLWCIRFNRFSNVMMGKCVGDIRQKMQPLGLGCGSGPTYGAKSTSQQCYSSIYGLHSCIYLRITSKIDFGESDIIKYAGHCKLPPSEIRPRPNQHQSEILSHYMISFSGTILHAPKSLTEEDRASKEIS